MKCLFLPKERFSVIAAASLLLIVIFNLTFFEKEKVVSKENFVYGVTLYKKTLPVLKEGVSFPTVSAKSVFAIDMTSGRMLFEKMPDRPHLPASTTKMITALVSLDYYPQDMVLEVGNLNIDGQKMNLFYGEKMRVKDLLYGLLVHSANDAAEVLAQNYPGGREMFVFSMNHKARELGLDNTYFVNPQGFDGEGQKTSARDLARVAVYLMQNPVTAEMVGTKEVEVTSIDGLNSHQLVNINKLIGEVDGVMGVKTGWTENAQENLVTYVERDGIKVIIALLSSQNRFDDTKAIIDWIFENYEWKEIDYPYVLSN